MAEKPLFSDDKKTTEKSIFDNPPKTTKNEKTDSEKPREQSSKKPTNPKKRKKILTTILSSVGALVLLSGGAVAAMWAVWHNSDDGVFASALSNLFLNDHTDISIDGSLTIKGGDEQADMSFVLDMLTKGTDGKFDFSFDASIPESEWVSGKTYYACGDRKYDTYAEAYQDCGWDYDYEYESGYYDYITTELSFSGSAITLADGYYFKADLSSLFDLMDESLPELEDYDDEWLFVSKDYLNELMDDELNAPELQACTENVAKNNPKAQDEMYSLFFKSNLIKATAEKPEKRKGGLINYSIELSRDVDDYTQFIKGFYALDIVDDMLDCYVENIDEFDRNEIDEELTEMIEELEGLTVSEREDFSDTIKEIMPKITVTVDRSARQITAMKVRGDVDGAKLTFTMNFKTNTRGDETIEAPSQYKNLKDVLD